MAGIAAQNRYSRKRDIGENGGQGDLGNFDKYWIRLNLIVGSAPPEEYEQFAREAVAQYWYAIRSFARRLLERETLEHDELEAALHAALEEQDRSFLPIPEHLCPASWSGVLPFKAIAELDAAVTNYEQALSRTLVVTALRNGSSRVQSVRS